VPAFSPDVVRALPEFGDAPDVDARLAATERASARSLPTADEEIWRYSRIGELELDRFSPAVAVTTVTGADGFVTDEVDEVDELELVPSPERDLFDELHRAFRRSVVVRVPAGRTVSAPVVVRHVVSRAGVAVFPRLVVDAAADSDVTVVEQFVSPDGTPALVVPQLAMRAAPAARVRYLGVNLLGRETWQIAGQRAVGDRDSSVSLAAVALGGDYARVRTDVRLDGVGATARQVALYYADGEQMHDFRTVQDHAAPRTNSDLLFKGAVQDRSRSVYTGLIRIRPEAKGSVAFQTNRNLTLSEGAWAESVPNLEIETNDVKCSHASSIGPIDDDQRFYLESRGVPPEVAERLVVLGFFEEVLAQLAAGDLGGQLRARVREKLERRAP
jgi:Fe-S cluster assembly protein SufD